MSAPKPKPPVARLTPLTEVAAKAPARPKLLRGQEKAWELLHEDETRTIVEAATADEAKAKLRASGYRIVEVDPAKLFVYAVTHRAETYRVLAGDHMHAASIWARVYKDWAHDAIQIVKEKRTQPEHLQTRPFAGLADLLGK